MEDMMEEQPEGTVSIDSCAFPFDIIGQGLEDIKASLGQLPDFVNEELKEHKVSARYKDKHREAVEREVGKVVRKLEKLALSCKLTKVMSAKIIEVLDARGIVAEDEWEQYIDTIEKDGEVLSAVCEVLRTDTLQVVEVAKGLVATVEDGAKGERERRGMGSSEVDWSALRAQMETLCGYLLGGSKRTTRSEFCHGHD
ncbi:hypothetical protein GCK32_022397 [Trichostrongylus colubriformis]|uniref:Uncharacterized protein n=1 Tax=Trichostrongylus colubriformis TaxID=6319 RepID=A0AAN8EXL1_TRICO